MSFIRTRWRRLHVAGFPYDLVYRVKGDVLEVLALAHHRRRPGHWKESAIGPALKRLCGPVRIESTEDISGQRPMNIRWRLEVPLPIGLFREFSVLRAGE